MGENMADNFSAILDRISDKLDILKDDLSEIRAKFSGIESWKTSQDDKCDKLEDRVGSLEERIRLQELSDAGTKGKERATIWAVNALVAAAIEVGIHFWSK